MDGYVTFPWLIGSGIAAVGILYTIFYNVLRSKVDTKFCAERHRNMDFGFEEIKEAIKEHSNELAQIARALARIEAILSDGKFLKGTGGSRG